MAGRVESRLQELGIELPPTPAPAATYVSYVVSRGLIYVSGQIPVRDGALLYVGRVGDDLDVATAQEAARLVALNLLAQAKEAAAGDLDRIARVVKLNGYVSCTPAFDAQSAVINGASELLLAILGAEVGSHARAAVGVAALPFGVSVEIDAVFELAD